MADEFAPIMDEACLEYGRHLELLEKHRQLLVRTSWSWQRGILERMRRNAEALARDLEQLGGPVTGK